MIKQIQLILGLVFLGLLLTGCSVKPDKANIDKTSQNQNQLTKNNRIDDNYNQFIAAGNDLSDFIKNFNELKQGSDFFFFEYADKNKIIIRNYAYLIIMKSQEDAWKIDSALDLLQIDCANTQGDFYTQVHILQNGNIAYIQNSSTINGELPPLYEYHIKEHALLKMENTKIPSYEASGVYVWGGNDQVYETSDGYRLRILNEFDKFVIDVLNKDDSSVRKIEMKNGNIELGYIGNGVAVQIAYPAEQNETMPYWGNCRLIFYNLITGETWEQRITEGL